MPDSITVTVLFTDVVGSTAIRQRQGETLAHELMASHNDLVRRHIEQHSGQEVKTIGDSFMVAFDSARSAIDCAVAVQRSLAERNESHREQPILVRIGIHTGEAIREGNDLFGTSVDAAARIMSRADGAQILVSDTLRAVLGSAPDLRLTDRGRFRLKGFPDRWRLWEVAWQQEEAPRPPGSVERSPFVGRFEERETLRRLLERALEGRGGTVLLGGEAGLGKTRLGEELAAEARQRGMFVARGQCYEMEGSPPYVAFVEAIEYGLRIAPPEQFRRSMGDAAPEIARLVPRVRLAFPDIPEAVSLPPEQARHFMFECVCDFFERASADQPLLLLLEDLHWADDSTVRLLERVARLAGNVPLLVLCTYRDTDLSRETPFRAAFDRLSRTPDVARILLRRMERAQVAQMLRGLAGRVPPESLVDLIFDETEGVPFFVEELYRHLHEERRLTDGNGAWLPGIRLGEVEVPETVRVVLDHRIDRVSQQSQDLLATAAVIGRAFSFSFLVELTGASEDAVIDALDEAERAHLISGTEGREALFSFAHEQIRQTLLGRLSSMRRTRLHRQVGEAIERHYAADLDPHVADLAHHFSRGGDLQRAAEYLIRSGDIAAKRLATEEALAYYTRAMEAAPDGPTLRLALRQRGLLLLALFRGNEAVRDLNEAARLARAGGATEDEIEALLGLANAYYVVSLDHGPSTVAYRETFERALALAVESGDRAREGRALLTSHWLADYDRRYRGQAETNVARALEIAGEVGDEDLRFEALRARFRLSPPAVQERDAAAIADELERAGRLVTLNEHLFLTMWMYLARARFERCIETCDRGTQLARRLGIPPVQYGTLKALALLEMGRFGESWSALQEEIADDEHPFGRSFKRWGEARWRFEAGDFEGAHDAAVETIEAAEALGRVWMQPWMHRVRLLAAIAMRLAEGGLPGLEDAGQAREDLGPFTGELLAETALANGEASNALDLIETDLARHEAAGRTASWLAAEELRLRALVALRRFEDAVTAGRAAVESSSERECGRLTWRFRASLAAALEGLGAPEAAAQRQLAITELKAVAATFTNARERERFLARPAATAILAATTHGRDR